MVNLTRIIDKNKSQLIGITAGLLIALLSYLILSKNKDLLYFMFVISFIVASAPIIAMLVIESRNEKIKDSIFLEFSRDLVESVKAGTPISKSILNLRNKDFDILNPHIQKLANQISLGIPLKAALETFARDINSITISRAINIISESEKAGGKIEDILDSVAKSVAQIEKLRKERAAAIYTLVVQGYIIFTIFIAIMLVMQYQILPIASQLSEGSSMAGEANVGLPGMGSSGQAMTSGEMAKPFIFLLIAQGFFAGLVIGKLSEGKIKAGIKHSFALVIIALLLYTGAKLLLGEPGSP
ncbi:MAG: type II secretion system F family protein [Candidatus Nanoarchaeia archaeon]